MGWFDRRRRSAGGGAGPGSGSAADPARAAEFVPVDEPQRFRAEIVSHYARGQFGEAADAARRLVEWHRKTVGEQHPDFTRSLANLALLLRRIGENDEAARLLTEVVATRRQILGTAHPETIEAESHLAALGQALPGTVVDESTPIASSPIGPKALSGSRTVQIVPARPATPVILMGAPTHDVRSTPHPPAETRHAEPRKAGGSSPLGEALAALADRIAALSHQIQSYGETPPRPLLDELTACRVQLDGLCRSAGLAIPVRSTPVAPEPKPVPPTPPAPPSRPVAPPPPRLATVPERREPATVSAGPAVREHEGRNGTATPRPAPSPAAAAPPVPTSPRTVLPTPAPTPPGPAKADPRKPALSVLDRVLRLTALGPAETATLISCQTAARQLRMAIAAEPMTCSQTELDRLNSGKHSFAAVLELIERKDGLADSAWAELCEQVTTAFGKPLTMALNRGRIKLNG